MKFREGLGYSYLSKPEKQAYKLVLDAFLVFSNSFNYSNIDRNVDIMKVIQTVLGDNPTVIYFNKTQIQIEQSIMGKKVLLSGAMSKPQVEKMNTALDAETNRVIETIKSSLPTRHDDYSLLLKLYEHLQTSVKYDRQELLANSKGVSPNPSSHNAYGALVNKMAVCDGFSSAFVLLAHRFGIESMLVIGKSAYESVTLTSHAWNIVEMQDKHYHIDVTWDARGFDNFEEFSYAYFALSDQEAARDHLWDRNSTPACLDNDLSYYVKNNLFAENEEQLNRIIKSAGLKYEEVFRIKLSPKIDMGTNVGDGLAQMYMNEIAKPGVQVKTSYGWNDKTRCFFAKIIK